MEVADTRWRTLPESPCRGEYRTPNAGLPHSRHRALENRSQWNNAFVRGGSLKYYTAENGIVSVCVFFCRFLWFAGEREVSWNVIRREEVTGPSIWRIDGWKIDSKWVDGGNMVQE